MAIVMPVETTIIEPTNIINRNVLFSSNLEAPFYRICDTPVPSKLNFTSGIGKMIISKTACA